MAQIEITRVGNAVNIKDVSSPASHQKVDFTGNAGEFYTILSSDGQAPNSDDSLTIFHNRRGAIGSYAASEFTTPSSADFSIVRPLVDALLMARAAQSINLADINSGNLPAGQWFFVPDLPQTDRGGWLFATSSTTYSENGVGMYLNADWQNLGDYSDVQAFTTVPPTANIGQWSPDLILFPIEIDNINYQVFITPTGGPGISNGDSLTDSGAWTGTCTGVGVGYITIISTTNGTYPTGTLTHAGTGSTATVDSIVTIAIGDTIDTPTWQGIVVSLPTTTSISVYTTTGADYPSVAEVFTNVGAIVGAEVVSMTTRALNVGDIVEYINPLAPEYGYRHYQCLGLPSDQLPPNGSSPFIALERGVEKFGYILASEPIKFDPINSVVVSREHGTIKVVDSFANQTANTYSQILAFPWGKLQSEFHDIDISEGRTVINNSLAAEIGPLESNGGVVVLAMHEGSVLKNVEAGRGSTIDATVNAGVTLDGLELGPSMQVNGTVFDQDKFRQRIVLGFSNAECVINITGLTEITIPADLAHCGIIRITSSNGAESVTLINGAPTLFDFKIYSSAGLALTLTGTAEATNLSSSIVMNVASIVLTGANECATFHNNETQNILLSHNGTLI